MKQQEITTMNKLLHNSGLKLFLLFLKSDV